MAEKLASCSFDDQTLNQPLVCSPQASQRVMFKLIQKVGSFGRYQKISLIVWCIVGYVEGGLNLVIPYLFFQDPYQCAVEPVGQSCLQFVCSLQASERPAFVPARSMRTISNQFGDYRCRDEQNTVDGMILLVYSSLTMSYLLLTFYGDYLGRRTFLMIGVIALVVGLLISVNSENLYVAVAGLFLAFFGSQWAYNFAMNFMSETISEEYRQKFMMCFFLAYGAGQCANVGYFYALADWRLVLLICYVVPAALALLLIFFVVVETPISLVAFHSEEEAREQLLWIAKMNKKQNISLEVAEIRKLKQMQQVRDSDERKARKFGLLDIFRYSSVRKLTLLFLVVEISIEFLFFGPNLMIDQFQASIFVNGLVLGGSALLSYFVCYFVIGRFKRKKAALFNFSVVTICCFVLIFLWKPKSEGATLSVAADVGMLIALFLINFLIGVQFTFYQVYTYELFPNQMKINAISFLATIGGLVIAASQFILDACINSGFSVMILFTMAGIAGVIVSSLLPESFEIPPPDLVPEINRKINSQKTAGSQEQTVDKESDFSPSDQNRAQIN